MIGLLVKEQERAVAQEFFELWKTPWEFARRGETYGALIVTRDVLPSELHVGELTIVLTSKKHPLDRHLDAQFSRVEQKRFISDDRMELPLYGPLGLFSLIETQEPVLTSAHECAAFKCDKSERRYVRVGYDLFAEIRFLLKNGQPPAHAMYPTLDLHIDFLRRCLRDNGIQFTEAPPAPEGHEFTCCLTHDIDFAGLSRHRFDSTMAGFFIRGTAGSVPRWITGRLSGNELLENWKEALALPLTVAGLRKDPWQPFRQYREIENELPATFFVLPFQGRPGKPFNGDSDSPRRASPYAAAELQPELLECMGRGCDVCLHGIDSWTDPEAARTEMAEIERITSQTVRGIRMHWLYFDGNSPQILENAGLSWDSTLGYNDAVGYRAGTSQVFRFLGCQQLLELPLIVQDTAMFYPDRMNLGPDEAAERCSQLIENARRFGGVLTINWHDRSLAPERQWKSFYTRLLDHLREADPWFATADQAVSWFRKRRSIKLKENGTQNQVQSFELKEAGVRRQEREGST